MLLGFTVLHIGDTGKSAMRQLSGLEIMHIIKIYRKKIFNLSIIFLIQQKKRWYVYHLFRTLQPPFRPWRTYHR